MSARYAPPLHGAHADPASSTVDAHGGSAVRGWLAVAALVVDLGVASALEPHAGPLFFAVGLIALVLFRHGRVLVPRPPMVLLAGGIAASALALGIDRVASWAVPHPPPSWWSIVSLPWPGHLIGFGLVRVGGMRASAPELGCSSGMGAAVKRALDVAVTLLLLPVVLPLVAGLALLVVAIDGAPAFHTHVRVTRGGRPFRILKLRTMVADAEPDGIAVWPTAHDPRITRLGRILRGCWLDEMPQLWNVLRGEMSLVGPRPERPRFTEEFSRRMPKYGHRTAVLAGLTGLAQVTGFIGNTSIDRRLELDLIYIRRWTPLLDLWILGRTIFVAARRALH